MAKSGRTRSSPGSRLFDTAGSYKSNHATPGGSQSKTGDLEITSHVCLLPKLATRNADGELAAHEPYVLHIVCGKIP